QRRLRQVGPRTALTILLVIFGVQLQAVCAGINEWTSHGPGGGFITALAVDPQNPNTVYAGTIGGGVFKSANGGASWSAANFGLTAADVRALAVDPRNPSTVYAGTNGAGVFKSTNGGASWSAANSGLTATDVHALAVDPQSPSTVYVVIYSA